LEISGKVQINMESIMDSKTVSDVDLMTRNKGDLMVITITEDTEYDLNSNHQDNNIGQVNNNKHAILEKQCALVKDMGLTHGEDTQKVKGMMIEMEKRDNNVAVEMGIKNHQP